MQRGRFISPWAGVWMQTLLCILLAVQPAAAAAPAAKDNKPVAATKPAATAPPPATRTQLSEPPPDTDLKARLAWADKEADGLRAVVAVEPRDEPSRVLLASLAMIVTLDLEQALSRSGLEAATGLRTLVEKKLADTRWRLGSQGRQGEGRAFFALAVISLHGILGPRDTEIACQLFASAWDKGFLEAAYRLAECRAEKDPAQSLSLLQTAAESGHATAREQLGRRCLEAKPLDAQCAFTHLAAAAEAGRASAKSLLGWMAAQGVGMPSDPARAQALYLEAAKAGDVSAANNLGELFETGRGVPADTGRAVEYYRQAAEAGFAPAQFNLGRMYAGGTGIARDEGAARKWLGAALQAGVQPAQKILDWLDGQKTQQKR